MARDPTDLARASAWCAVLTCKPSEVVGQHSVVIYKVRFSAPVGEAHVLSERLHPAPADPRRDDPAWAAGLARPRSRSTATQSKALTASFRREAFAANANAADSAEAQKRSYIRRVMVVDVLVVTVAVMLGYLARFQGSRPGTDVPYVPVGVGLIALWGLVLVWNRCYDDRILGYGADEYRRVVGGSLKLAGAVAIVSYLADFQGSRGVL